jgi:hypothetical protein
LLLLLLLFVLLALPLLTVEEERTREASFVNPTFAPEVTGDRFVEFDCKAEEGDEGGVEGEEGGLEDVGGEKGETLNPDCGDIGNI